MSEQSQGPGWWQASDGKWYPPEQGAPAGAQPPVTQPVGAVPPPVGPPPVGGPGGPGGPPPAYAAPAAAAGGGGGAGKIVAIIVAVALVAGGAAFLLTRDSGGGGSLSKFCAEGKQLDQKGDQLDVTDPKTTDATVAEFNKLVDAAPSEIKADVVTLRDLLKKISDAVKKNQSAFTALSTDEQKKLDDTGKRVEAFGFQKCGPGFGFSDTGSDSSASSSSSRSSSSSSRSSSSSSSSDNFSDSLSSLFSDFSNFSDFSDFFSSSS